MTDAQITTIRVGTIIRTPSGYRVVRAVKHWPPRRNNVMPGVSVTFTIMRRSWTGRCYTILGRSDLRCRHYQPTTAKLPLRDKLSRKIAREVERGTKTITPEQVAGIR